MLGVLPRLFLMVSFLVSSSVSLPLFSQTLSTLYFNNSIVAAANIGMLASTWSVPQTNYYIVQFSGSSTVARGRITAVAKIVRYVPHNAFVVKTDTISALKNLKGISSVIAYSPFLKVDQKLLKESSETPMQLELHLFPGEDVQQIVDHLSPLPLKVVEYSEGRVLVTSRLGQLNNIAYVNGVEWISKKNDVVVPAMPGGAPAVKKPQALTFEELKGYASGAKVLNPDRLYKKGIRGKGELVAFADSGVDLGKLDDLHADLAGRVKFAESLAREATGSWDDPMGHGTHVAGLIAGNGKASNGYVRGVAFESDLMIQSAFKWRFVHGNLLKTFLVPADMKTVLKSAYKKGARIHSNSWHFSSNSYGIHSSQLDEYLWNHPDMVVLFAAGNSGVDLNGDGRIDASSIPAPSNAKNCITVGASENLIHRGGLQHTWGKIGDFGLANGKSKWGSAPLKDDLPSNHLNGLAAFSSRGLTKDGRVKPDLVAPGTNNLSVRSRSSAMTKQETWGVFNKDYVFMGGTSMATPLAAGGVALVRQYYKDIQKRSFISSSLVKATLVNGAHDIFPGQFTTFREIPNRRPNGHEGFGRVDLENSLIPKGKRYIEAMDRVNGVSEGESESYMMRVTDTSEPLRITLAYTDYPASPAVSKSLVNDLDLVLVDERGMRYFPNRLGKADRVNNVEHIDVNVPNLGNYTVYVRGHAVPLGKGKKASQPFALVVSGAFQMVL